MDFYKKIFKSKKIRFKILSLLKFIPDKQMLKLQYRIKCGRKLELKKPTRYTEKIQWYKLNYRDPLMQKCADKYAVREYVKEKGLAHILNDLYEVFETPKDISFERLPAEFVLKLSNGSSTNVLVKDKTKTDIYSIRKKFEDFYNQSSTSAGREWVYKSDEAPVIVAEKLLKNTENPNSDIRDYKILCFNGTPQYIICVDGRYTEDYCHVIYDTDWNKLNVSVGESSCASEYECPTTLDEMLEYATILSKDFPAARVDFYSISGKVYFGEITFFPWSGYMTFDPDDFDRQLGELFVLPSEF